MRKFSQSEILEIRSKRAAGQTQPALALEYGCSVNTIRSIEKGLSYREVGGFAAPAEHEALESQDRFLAMIAKQGAQHFEPTPDPTLAILARAEPLEVSMRRAQERDALEHAERMQGIKQLRSEIQSEEHTDEQSQS